MNILDEKKSIRKKMRTLRSALSLMEYRTLSEHITRRAGSLPEMINARIVHVYVSAVNNEVGTHSFIRQLLLEKKQVTVPKCRDDKGIWSIRIDSFVDLAESRFGLLEPVYHPEKDIPPEALECVIAPLLAFDRTGARLGFGGGYYDSLLDECSCPVVGLAFSFQEVPRVPIEPHDRSLDIIVTEKEIIRCDRSS